MTTPPSLKPAGAGWRLHPAREVDRSERGGAVTERRQFIRHNVIAALGTSAAGVCTLILQALLSHRFHPAQYGQLLGVLTFFTLITQPAAAFSRLVAWQTSQDRGRGHGYQSAAVLRSAHRRLLIGGTLVAAALSAVAPWVGGFINAPTDYVVIAALSVPFTLATPALLGAIQGEQRFTTWSLLTVATAASRIVFAMILLVPFGIRGALSGITLASAIVYLITLRAVWSRLRTGRECCEWRKLMRFLVVSVASTLTVAMLLGSDVVMVQHYFGGRVAGEYGAVAVSSRALFFAMGSVTSVLFPKVAARHASAQRTTSVVLASVGMSLAAGLVSLLVFATGAHTILAVFAGRAYDGGADYLGLYALGMPLLGAVVMLSNTQMSLDRFTLLLVLIPGMFLKPVLIALFHDTVHTVVVVSDLSIGAIFLALAVLYAVQERERARDLAPSPMRVKARWWP